VGALTAELLDLLLAAEDEWLANPRDMMRVLAPYHDCAWRLGADPARVFDTVASGAPASLRDMVRVFGRRDDITPESFGFAVVETADGPEYVQTL
jgi:hypothetical protein